ncbi:hypothetical protein AQUCO_02200203v1 [Aquilegia coerulea]|uniref:Uncharacterized protein n=1 Tax=Aquilegia coerulea TaxID=218851 RepID=A0A2G5DDN7_AQUCA|nr:hypothetical protein AQUCO_02200203v1 [Aquilegia coerulea]PIA41594.1 hypothetical protein AQUCO_02200203v1 [Aquilegia coerulea]
MVSEDISSPNRTSEPSSEDKSSRNSTSEQSSSTSLKNESQPVDELGSWGTILRRHQFLLIMMSILYFICAVYLYFAVTLGNNGRNSG